ncbi:hypothetical protein [Streptomyces regalis]
MVLRGAVLHGAVLHGDHCA